MYSSYEVDNQNKKTYSPLFLLRLLLLLLRPSAVESQGRTNIENLFPFFIFKGGKGQRPRPGLCAFHATETEKIFSLSLSFSVLCVYEREKERKKKTRKNKKIRGGE